MRISPLGGYGSWAAVGTLVLGFCDRRHAVQVGKEALQST